jgi:choline dehydrogenase
MQSNAVEAAAYVRSDRAKAGPDIKMVLMQLPIVTDEIRAEYGSPPADCFTIAPALVRPEGRGSVRLASADWRDDALLETGFLSTDEDLKATVRCIEMCRELGHQQAYDGIRTEELIPGAGPTVRDLKDFARKATISFGHQVGSCRMGTDATAVVDPKLRVRGVEGLRVCDSSIMPRIITGPTNAASQMIGAKAASLILESR